MPQKAKTLADFRDAHDPEVIIPKKITAVLAAIAKEGVENWEYEGDVVKRAGISQTQLGQFREQFKKHIVETGGRNPKRVWFGDAKTATKLRGE